LDDRLNVLKLSFGRASVSEYRNALIEDFGSISNHLEMRSDKLFTGDFGLDGLLYLIRQILDVMSTDDP